jgi:hypothetical protein
MSSVEQARKVEVDPETEVAKVVYVIDDKWRVTVERDLKAPTGGPTMLRIEPQLGETEMGGWDSAGIQQSDLRAVPIGDARQQLEEAWIELRAHVVITGIPEDFSGDYAFAKLAEAMVTLHGWNIANPVGVIARHREPHTHGTWATRVKRARERGYMTSGPEPTLTGKSLALLRG